MTPQEINKALAGKVMGWRFVKSQLGNFYRMSKINAPNKWADQWDPYYCIDDAMMCLEKFDSWEMYKHDDGKYKVVVWPKIGDGRNVNSDWQNTKEKAACLAVLKAVEVDNETR